MAEQFNTMEMKVEDFIDRTTILYGISDSGKSTIIKHILFLLRGMIPLILAFSQSEIVNHTYSHKMMPRSFVHDNVSADVIMAMQARQVKARQVYEQVNNIQILQSLINRIMTQDIKDTLNQIEQIYEETARANNGVITDEMENTFANKKISIMRSIIKPKLQFLQRITDLSESEKFTIKMFDFNPRIIIIFDDCSTDIAELKSCAEVLEQVFRGRHLFCTVLMAVHGISLILPMMRIGVGNSIFTDPQTARQFAESKTNALDRQKKSEMIRYAGKVVKKEPPFTKLLYRNDKFYLVRFPTHEPFVAVSEQVRLFGEKIAIKGNEKNGEQLESWMKQLLH